VDAESLTRGELHLCSNVFLQVAIRIQSVWERWMPPVSPSAGAAVGKALDCASDIQLVRECLRGRESAWVSLVRKYKNLIFSIPIKDGFSHDEAADIFQAVCLDLLYELPRLRDPQALAGWLIRVTHNKCFHLRRDNARFVPEADRNSEPAAASEEIPDNFLHQLERDQHVRSALGELSPRCRVLVEKLFFEWPSRPYQLVARELGLAVGSIGFIRRRCLNRLRDRLEELGVR
jgi:RNA polymerase sigma factor (sigma-70 family)